MLRSREAVVKETRLSRRILPKDRDKEGLFVTVLNNSIPSLSPPPMTNLINEPSDQHKPRPNIVCEAKHSAHSTAPETP